MAPMAIPKAAVIPANLAMSNGCPAVAGAGLSAAARSLEVASVSFCAAFLLILSVMKFASLRYGLQNACLMLTGLSTTLVITASQSLPCRS